MTRKNKPEGPCEFTGCKSPAVWVAHKLWGKGGTICTCDGHKPGGKPGKVPPPRPFYRVEPIVAEMTDAELDRLTERCANGDPDAEADYNRLTRRAIAGGQ